MVNWEEALLVEALSILPPKKRTNPYICNLEEILGRRRSHATKPRSRGRRKPSEISTLLAILPIGYGDHQQENVHHGTSLAIGPVISGDICRLEETSERRENHTSKPRSRCGRTPRRNFSTLLANVPTGDIDYHGNNDSGKAIVPISQNCEVKLPPVPYEDDLYSKIKLRKRNATKYLTYSGRDEHSVGDERLMLSANPQRERNATKYLTYSGRDEHSVGDERLMLSVNPQRERTATKYLTYSRRNKLSVGDERLMLSGNPQRERNATKYLTYSGRDEHPVGDERLVLSANPQGEMNATKYLTYSRRDKHPVGDERLMLSANPQREGNATKYLTYSRRDKHLVGDGRLMLSADSQGGDQLAGNERLLLSANSQGGDQLAGNERLLITEGGAEGSGLSKKSMKKRKKKFRSVQELLELTVPVEGWIPPEMMS